MRNLYLTAKECFRGCVDALFCRVHLVVTESDDPNPNRIGLKVFVGGFWPFTLLWIRYKRELFLALIALLAFFLGALGAVGALHIVCPAASHIYWQYLLSVISPPKSTEAFWPLLGIGSVLILAAIVILPRPLLPLWITLIEQDQLLPEVSRIYNASRNIRPQNFAIRLENQQTRQVYEPLRALLEKHPGPWIIPDETAPTNGRSPWRKFRDDFLKLLPVVNVRKWFCTGQCRSKSHKVRPAWSKRIRSFLYRWARWPREYLNAYKAKVVSWLFSRWEVVFPYRNTPRWTVPLPRTPKLYTLGQELAGIARFAIQQFIVATDSDCSLPIPGATESHKQREKENKWLRIANELHVSLRLHSVQLAAYLFLLAVVFLSTAYQNDWFHVACPTQHPIGPFVVSGLFFVWVIVSIVLRGWQIEVLQDWAGRHKGMLILDSPLFYHRVDRPPYAAWEELDNEDFDVEIHNFGLDHSRLIEFAYAALLVIAFEILEKLV